MSVTQAELVTRGRLPSRRRHAGAPAPDAALVERPRLVQPLCRAPAGQVVVIAAPAGYGKTTLLRQWERRDRRRFRWLPAGGDALVHALAEAGDGSVIVLDGFEALRDPVALRAVLLFAADRQAASLLAIASRAEPGLPLGRLRAQRALLELGPGDLAMTRREAAQLLRRAGLPLAPPAVDALVRSTEGWPAGLLLAANSLSRRDDRAGAVAAFGGDDRFVADYLRDEVVEPLAPEEAEFATRTAQLGELSGPLCDAALGCRGSGRVLRDLARGNLLVTALDGADQRFRYHPLLADMLRAEHERSDPDDVRTVDRRASAWHEEHGDLGRAFDHALAAGERARAAELLWAAAQEQLGTGDVRPLELRLARFRPLEIGSRPALALVAAAVALLRGDRDEAERWTSVCDPDARPLAGAHAAIQAAIGRDGMAGVGDDAQRALELASPISVWHPLALFLLGVARHLTGERGAAVAALDRAGSAARTCAPFVQALSLGQLALLAVEDGDVEAAVALTARALSEPEARGPTPSMVFAASAFARAQAGDVATAHEHAAAARRQLAQAPAAAPWYDAQTRIALARAELRLSDAAGARTLLAEASRALRRAPDAVVLREWIDDAWARADSFAVEAVVGPTTLTTAELRVLRFLPSHLSFREVAARLHVSANTVKTQAHAVYRKLGASSRSEAVARAREVGLVDL